MATVILCHWCTHLLKKQLRRLQVLGVTLPPPLTPEAAAAAVEVSEAPAEPQVEEAGSSESPEATPRVATPVTESAVQPDVASNDTSGGSNNTAAIVGGVAAVIVGCIVAAVAVLMYIRYRRRSRAGKNFQVCLFETLFKTSVLSDGVLKCCALTAF